MHTYICVYYSVDLIMKHDNLVSLLSTSIIIIIDLYLELSAHTPSNNHRGVSLSRVNR